MVYEITPIKSDRAEIRKRVILDNKMQEIFSELIESIENLQKNENRENQENGKETKIEEIDLSANINEIKERYEEIYEEKEEEYLNEISKNPMKRIYYRKINAKTKNKFITKSGIKVKSKIEKIIADFYYEKDIKFIYEFGILIGQIPFLIDFYLPDFNIYHEHFGFNSEEYNKTKVYKQKMLEGLNIFYTEGEDEEDIETAIMEKLKEKSS